MNNKEYYILENERIMFELIEKHNAGDNIKNFVKDGIVNPDVWFNLPPEKEKILFLLKESYEGNKNIKRISDLTKWICKTKCTEICDKKFNCQKKCGAKGKTFCSMMEWIYGINCISENKEKKYDNDLYAQTRKMRDDLLQSVAVINVKKADGKNRSSDTELYFVAQEDKEELIEQIKLINPSVIICGRTYGMLKCLYPDIDEIEDVGNGACMYKGRKIIATCHPSNINNITSEEKYNNVMALYKSLL